MTTKRPPTPLRVLPGGKAGVTPETPTAHLPHLWPWIATTEWVERLNDEALAVLLSEQVLAHLPMSRTNLLIGRAVQWLAGRRPSTAAAQALARRLTQEVWLTLPLWTLESLLLSETIDRLEGGQPRGATLYL